MGFLSGLFGTKDNTILSEAIKNGAYLVDVRMPSEFSAGSIKGAVNIPLGQLQNQMSKMKGKKNIVVFCRSGARSSQAKSMLEKNGFENVINGGALSNMIEVVNG